MRRICLATLPLLLASCGGDDDSATGEGSSPPTAAPAPSPTPSPTPAPSPTPSPTPSPSSYPTYDQQTGSVTLLTAQAGYSVAATPPTPLAFRGFASGATIQYDATAKSYALSVNGSNDSFVSSELAAGSPAGTQRYVKANGRTFTVTQPMAAGRGFDYLRFARLTTTQSDGTPITASFVTGVVTRGTDVPSTGSVTLSRTVVAGEAYVTANGATTAYSLGRSTLTISVDFAAGRVTGRLVLIGTPVNGGADVTLSTIDANVDFTGPGTVTPVSGEFTPNANSLLAGAFFGPRANETGLLLSLQGTSASGARLTLIASGAGGS